MSLQFLGAKRIEGTDGDQDSILDVPIGTTFTAIDTFIEYVFDGLIWNPIGGLPSDDIVATGGTVTQVGDFKVHTFTGAGDFEILSGSGSVEHLVIAGGGGGVVIFGKGGGGGAGGNISASENRTIGTFPVTIGAGGTGGNPTGNNGANSVFSDVTAIGGGGGGANTGGAGNSGGSGGGGGDGNGVGGLGTAGQGFDGGLGTTNDAAGGGGASEVGFDGVGTGDGGDGLQNNIDGLNLFRAGGGGGAHSGGGSSGGNGGGGNGGDFGVASTSGTVNTGGGGGSVGDSGGGTDGGSGIVIVSYFSPFVPPPAVGGWKEVGRDTLGAPATTLTVSSVPNKGYYMVLCDFRYVTSSFAPRMRLNNVSAAEYAHRISNNGGTDSAVGNQTGMELLSGGSNIQQFGVQYFGNLVNKEKLVTSHEMNTAASGSGIVPIRQEAVFKWADTTNAINQFDIFREGGTGSLDTGSEMVVLEWDPTDTHTDNFWEELGTVQGDGTQAIEISIPARKYLWIQGFCEDTQSLTLRFNDDASNIYSRRFSIDGGADNTAGINLTSIGLNASTTTIFFNTFIINNQTQEKLVIHHDVERTASGLTPPTRFEVVAKWTNTASLITKLNFGKATNFSTASFFKVWGHD